MWVASRSHQCTLTRQSITRLAFGVDIGAFSVACLLASAVVGLSVAQAADLLDDDEFLGRSNGANAMCNGRTAVRLPCRLRLAAGQATTSSPTVRSGGRMTNASAIPGRTQLPRLLDEDLLAAGADHQRIAAAANRIVPSAPAARSPDITTRLPSTSERSCGWRRDRRNIPTEFGLPLPPIPPLAARQESGCSPRTAPNPPSGSVKVSVGCHRGCARIPCFQSRRPAP